MPSRATRRRRRRRRSTARRGGSVPPSGWGHVTGHPVAGLGNLAPAPATTATTPGTGEVGLPLPAWIFKHDQGDSSQCVGFALALERAITNGAQAAAFGDRSGRRYSPTAIWRRGREHGGQDPSADGVVQLRHGFDVLRLEGAPPCSGVTLDAAGRPSVSGAQPFDPDEGIVTNRWCTTVDEMRAAMLLRLPIVVSLRWFDGFMQPRPQGALHWLPKPAGAGSPSAIGWHAVVLYGMTDRLGAFWLANSWGEDFPLCLLPYETMADQLASHQAEAAVVTDR